MLTEAEKADCFACWDAGKPWLGREMSHTEHAAVSEEYRLHAAGVLPVMARKAAIAEAANGKVKVRWSEIADPNQWSKTGLRDSTPAEIKAERQAFARRVGVDPSAVTVHADGTATALVSAEVAAAAAKEAAYTDRAMPYLVAQARAPGFGKPEDGDDRAPGHRFDMSRAICAVCGVTWEKFAERGGTCRFVAEPASPVHVEPSLGRAMRKVREFGTVLGAGRWMAPK